jgi:pimeloyl-ACP methyl ester carboxylesterase
MAAHPEGRAPVRVVAVPGLGLSVEVACRALRRIPDVHPSVRTLPGYGCPARSGTPLAPERLAGLLLDALAPAVLVGHSASCQVVTEAAVRAPERVRALVLVGPTTDPRAVPWRVLVARWLRTAAHEHPGQVPLLVAAYARTGPPAMVRAMDAARRHRLDHALAAVRCPVLVVRGAHDAICPADWAERLAAAAPDGRAATLPAGGHMLPITHPADLAARISAFLRSVTDRLPGIG